VGETKLSKVRIRNFRCFRDETEIDFDDLTVLVGKNDAGKSTVMDALNLFFNEKLPDKDDASKDGNAEDLTIACEFDDLPSEVIIDEEFHTNLASEYLLNQKGNLEIHKTFNGSLQSPKLASVDLFAFHPSVENAEDLVQLSNSNLKKRAEDLAVDLSGVDERTNAKLRKAIRDSIGDLILESRKIPLNKDNGSKIREGLKKYLPSYSLFKSDREGTDQDEEAQDPLKVAVKEAVKSKEEDFQRISDYVKSEVEKIAKLTLENLREIDPTLASKLNPTFSPPKWESSFRTSITGDDEIPINKRGSGVRRLILLSFFRAKGEQLANSTDNVPVIYAFEEPETSQHPHNQRLLMRTLSNLSSEGQVIISTHTPTLARAFPDNSIRYIRAGANGRREILKGGSTTNSEITRSLGVLPDNIVRLFIAVEGVNDVKFMQNISKILHSQEREMPDLEKMEADGEVIFILLGGSNLAYWTNKLLPLNRPEFHLYDRDVQPPMVSKYQAHVDDVNSRPDCLARLTSRREIENYIHNEAIIKAYKESGIELQLTTNFGHFDDVPLAIARLVHEASESGTSWDQLTTDQKRQKTGRAKHTLCLKAAGMMTASQLDEIDQNGEVRGWFQDIQGLLSRAT
jgi:predicted ATPase